MYNLFQSTVRPGDVSHQSDQVFDMSGARLTHKLRELKVNNIEELHRVTNDLLSMPILFHIKVQHERTDHYVVVKVRKKWTDEFAVLVNTRHSRIRELMTDKLTQAMQYMQEGKKFCLKLDFGPSVRQWYSGIVDSPVSFCDSRSNNDSGDMTIWVTNYTTPMECCMSPLCIVLCFPLWLVCGGPCYVTHRKLNCIDEEQEINDLPVTLLSGVVRTVTVQRPVPVAQVSHYPADPRPQPSSGAPQGQPQQYPGAPQDVHPPQYQAAPPQYSGPPPDYASATGK